MSTDSSQARSAWDHQENSPVPLATGLWHFECERLAVARTIHSIQNQVEHHRTRTFPQEDLAFLKRPDHSTHSTRCRLLRAGALSLAHAGAQFRRQISVGLTRTSTVPPGRDLSASLPRHFVPGYYQPVPPGQKPFAHRSATQLS